ncbi:hypothetical protein [Microbacterium sp. 10M-3C3]|uniref:hypothetical protein n=1 Tax=Microbacterium sp. 10M-3C3 TaxID=2483401 RepID=UPI000F644E17|nr:hypothetical protein [Microbacterium sp. 10M-3C3]
MTRPLLALAAVGALCAGLAGCAVTPPTRPAASPSADAPTPSPGETTAPDAGTTIPGEDAFAEREAFFAAQGQPRDGSLPTPQTPEQQRFVDEQRAYVEAQGGQWDEFYDGVALAAALDACETSILNSHAVFTDTARAHIASSPLIAQIAQGDPAAEQGLASIMVFGTGFLCPADAPQWEAAFAEIYG